MEKQVIEIALSTLSAMATIAIILGIWVAFSIALIVYLES
jgi:hypothetical protein